MGAHWGIRLKVFLHFGASRSAPRLTWTTTRKPIGLPVNGATSRTRNLEKNFKFFRVYRW